MEFSMKEDGKDPVFFNLDEEILRISRDIDNYTVEITKIDDEYRGKYDHIQVKVDRLHALLGKYKQEMDKLRNQQDDARLKRRRKYFQDKEQLQALEIQKQQELANKDYAETVQLIKEICAEFEAWHMAREYQVEDIVQIVHQYSVGSSGVMNANEMALGKTFETLVALFVITELFTRQNKRQPTVLWLSKKSLIETGSTYAECKRWFPQLKVFPLKGSSNKHAVDAVFRVAGKGGTCVLTNYETAKKMPLQRWDFVIMDEVHKLKGGANASGPTAIWETIKGLDIGFQFMLTGTPLVNNMNEIWSYLHLFDRKAFPDAKEFSRNFQAYRDIAGEMKFDANSERMLKDILRGRLIRRTAKEVGLQMPPVNEQEIWLQHNDFKQASLYQQMRERFFVMLDGYDDDKMIPAMSMLTQALRLRMINVLPVFNHTVKDPETKEVIETLTLDCRDSAKIDETIELIEKTGDQCLVFSNFNEPLEELALRLAVEGKRCEVISSAHSKEMGDYESDFQQGKIDVLAINMAMGEGMNLHKDAAKWPGGARAVIILDRWFNDARNRQCISRAVRPGEHSGEPVFVYYLMIEHSIDLWLKAMCEEKSSQFDAVTESTHLRPAKEWKKMLRELL